MNEKNLKNKGKIKNRRIYLIACILFWTYIIFLLWRVFFYAYGSFYRVASETIRYNIIPFKTIGSYFIGFYRYSFRIWFFNLFGNIMAFMPLGFFVPVVFEKIKKIKHTIFIGTSLSTCIEMAQIITRVGTFDVDDIILNTIGTLIGYRIYLGVQKYISNQK